MTDRQLSAVLTVAVATIAAIGAFLLWWNVAPPALGGRTTLLTTEGVSMNPTIHEGDLVVLRKQPAYRAGDIVAYESPTHGGTVLHRIVRTGPDGFETKGDNNSTVDPYRPAHNDITGKVVAQYSGVGGRLSFMHSPIARIAAAGLAVWALAVLLRPARRSAVPRRAASRVMSSAMSRLWEAPLPVVLGGLLSVALALCVLGFSRPVTMNTDEALAYHHQAKFDYAGPARGGDLVYRNGTVSTGDPIYLKLVDRLTVDYTYELQSVGSFSGTTDATMEAWLEGSTGWRHPLVTNPEANNTGTTAQTRAEIDLVYVRDVITRVQAETAVRDASFTLAVQSTVQVDGKLDGAPFAEMHVQRLDLQGEELRLQLDDGRPNGKTERLTGGAITTPRSAPAALSAVGVTVGVLTLRIVGIAGLVIGLVATAAAVMAGRRRLGTPADGAYLDALDDYGPLMVPVSGWNTANDTMLIDVPDLQSLGRIAEQYQSVIMHEPADNTYVVSHGRLTYRYVHSGRRERFTGAPSADSREQTAHEETAR